MKNMEDNDESIVSRVQHGDAEAFGVLIDRYDAKLKRYANKFLIYDDLRTDLVQDVFVKAYMNIQSFDTYKRFSPWIYRIAHNTFVNELSRRKSAPTRFFDADIFLPYLRAPETADQETYDKDLKEALDTSLSELPAKYREPLVLHFYEHMPYQDIGEVLQVPISTVGMRIMRAKQKLRKIYEAKHI